MSRVANSPVTLPKGVDIKIEGLNLSVKGGKGTLDLTLTDGVGVNVEEDVATITYEATAIARWRVRPVRCWPTWSRVSLKVGRRSSC